MAPPTPVPTARAATASAPTTSAPADTSAGGGTRERILDIATELFIEHGYDGTSLRQIAEEVGVTKAALYYHFASKAELVAALLEPFEQVQREWVDSVPDDPTDAQWADSLGTVIDWMVDNRDVFRLFERNHEVFEALHDENSSHQELHGRITAVLGNPSIDARRRIRMAAALGVSMAMAPMGDSALDDLDPDEIRLELRAAVHRALGL
jgi:AcrR family transcriptional regulator